MKNPSFRTWLLGSPFTAPFVMGSAGWYSWQWWQAGGSDNTGLITLALMGFSAKAIYEVAAYRRWRADWRAMSPNQPEKRYCTALAPWLTIIGMIAVGAVTLWASSPDAPAQVRSSAAPLAMVAAMLGIALMIIRLIARVLRYLWTRWRGQRQGKLRAVTLVIKRPILRAPSISTCYRRLPPYAKMLLKGCKP